MKGKERKGANEKGPRMSSASAATAAGSSAAAGAGAGASSSAGPEVCLVTAGFDHALRFWDLSTGQCETTLQHPDWQVNALAISRDKRFVAAAGNPNVRVFDTQGGKGASILSFEGHLGNVTAVGWEEDGKWLYTASEDGTIKIWDVRTPSCQKTFEARAPVNSATLHPNQAEILSGDQNGLLAIWDLSASGSSVTTTCPEQDVAIRSVAVAADGSRAAAASSSGKVYVWEPATSATFGTGPTALGVKKRSVTQAHETYILRCLFSPDGRLLATTSADHTARIFRVGAGGELETQHVLAKHQRWVWDAQFSADSQYLVTASSDTSARLWSVETGEMLRHFTGHTKAVVAVALNDF